TGNHAGEQPLPPQVVLEQRCEFSLVFNDRDLLLHEVTGTHYFNRARWMATWFRSDGVVAGSAGWVGDADAADLASSWRVGLSGRGSSLGLFLHFLWWPWVTGSDSIIRAARGCPSARSTV